MTVKSSSVVTSPFTSPLVASSLSSRRMIFPLRVLGRASVKRIWSGLAKLPICLPTQVISSFFSPSLGRLFALTEAYPDLKATGNVAGLQEELTSTENKIGFARQLYNDVATQYNTKQMQFPTNLVAGLAKASPAELWEIEDVGERAVPVVDLSLNKRVS